MARGRIGFKLSKQDRVSIELMIKKGEARGRVITRCRILQLRDRGFTREEVSESLEVDMKTVTTICSKYVEGGVELAIHDKARSGRPGIFDGKQKAKITAIACSEAPDGYSQWSLRLLADRAVELCIVDFISHTDVGRILKKTKSSRT